MSRPLTPSEEYNQCDDSYDREHAGEHGHRHEPPALSGWAQRALVLCHMSRAAVRAGVGALTLEEHVQHITAIPAYRHLHE